MSIFIPFLRLILSRWSQGFRASIALLCFAVLMPGGMTRFASSAQADTEATLPTAPPAVVPSGSNFVGAQACAQCHQTEYRAWWDSQHAKAMQPASGESVLGDFRDAAFSYAGITSTFFRRDGNFMVRTDGSDGTLQDYQIAYTFGVYPLQQYLIGFPDGRYQALGIAWDSRPAEQGGQRWFHLYPDLQLRHQDTLHWTGYQQNWNHMCAECHSTNLRKNYDPQHKRFNTIWSEINVSCEACHGPGIDHLAWARQEGDWEKLNTAKGLAITFDKRRGLNAQLRTLAMQGLDLAKPPANSLSPGPSRELEMCARCHSRRG